LLRICAFDQGALTNGGNGLFCTIASTNDYLYIASVVFFGLDRQLAMRLFLQRNWSPITGD
jgi:hypothetical protein